MAELTLTLQWDEEPDGLMLNSVRLDTQSDDAIPILLVCVQGMLEREALNQLSTERPGEPVDVVEGFAAMTARLELLDMVMHLPMGVALSPSR